MRLFRWTLGLLIVTLLLTGSVVIGSRRLLANQMKPSVRELAMQMCEPQPCWHNIRVGVTTFKQAYDVITSDSSLEAADGGMNGLCWKKTTGKRLMGCFFDGDDGTVSLLILFPEEDDLRLGDLFSFYGNPVAVTYCKLDTIKNFDTKLYFLSHTSVIWVSVLGRSPHPVATHLQPDMVVIQISHIINPQWVLKPQIQSIWKGFAHLNDC